MCARDQGLTPVDPDLLRTREFFGARAERWDERFPDDEPAYAVAIAEFGLRPGGVAVDLGCGTGRALPHLRGAVGVEGVVLGVDVTPEMVLVAAGKRGAVGRLALADVSALPFASESVDAFFAAGLLTHVPDAHVLLRELARAARSECRLAVFHPIGRATLAERHGRALRPDELLDPSVLPNVFDATGWMLEHMDDAEDRYLAVARVAR